MRTCGYANLSVLWVIGLCVPLCGAAAPEQDGVALRTRQELVGAWRLVGIEYSDRSGPLVDPFYQAGSTGIIIYDASGWMSVHIGAPHRKAWNVPESRLPPDAGAPDSALKAAAFDSYYAYFGTWDFDETKSVVTHHVKSSLIPAETGLDYPQKVTLENGHLIFTGHGGAPGRETTRIKIWERVSGVAR